MHEAEDLASEVFVRALRSSHKYVDTGAPLEAWIFKIAHNIVVDHFRKKSRRGETVELDAAGERREELQQLHKAMESVTDAQRQVLALRFGAEMTSEEAAEVMGKKPGAVREMQSAAIKKLREVMRDG